MAANLQGSDVVLLGASIDALPFELWSMPSIKTPEQLKGTKLGVSRIGATTDFVARYLLKKWNLQPDKDVAIFQTGSGPQIFAAIKGGSVQSGVLSTGPETISAEASGFVRLTDVSTSGLVYPFGPFAARQAFLKSQPDLVTRFMKAYVEGIHKFKSDKTAALAVLEKYTSKRPRPLRKKSTRSTRPEYFKRAPEATPAAIQTIIEELSASRAIPPGTTSQRFADSRFIRDSSAAASSTRFTNPASPSTEEKVGMKTILQNHVPYNTGWAAEMKQGQVIRITATTTVDFVFFKLQNLIERFDQPRTKVYNMKLFISTGDKPSGRNQTQHMMTIVYNGNKNQPTDSKGYVPASRFKLAQQENRLSAQIYPRIKEIPDHGCYRGPIQGGGVLRHRSQDVPARST